MLLKKKKKQSTRTMEDHVSLLYRDIEGRQDFFDAIDYEVSSILLQLSHPVVFSSDAPLLHKWGRTKKRCSSVFLHPPKISPPSAEVAEMGSTSSSSCLTGEAKKTIPQSINKGFEDEFSTTNQRSKLKITSQPNASSCSVLESEMGLIGAQVGLLAQPISEKRRIIVDDQNLLHLQPLICVGDRTVSVRDVETPSLRQQARDDDLERRGGFDLNLPAAEEEGNHIVAMFDFQRVATKSQAAAQARQRRLALIRSKKRFTRFISSSQYK